MKPDDNALILRVDHHVAVHVVGEGVNVWWIFVGRLNATRKTKMRFTSHLWRNHMHNKFLATRLSGKMSLTAPW